MPSEMSNPPDPPAAASGAGLGSSSTKRRRTSEHSSLAVPNQSDMNYARSSPTPRVLTRGSPQRGSSREMTPPDSSLSIKYTRTGRVSKATKGQRVHHCDECGKTYTRAEHLRRHQQNHKPGAFPCDIPGCGRSFYREDLLTRHKARHDDPLNPPSRPQSRGSQDSRTGEERITDTFSRAVPQQPTSTAVAPGGVPALGEADALDTSARGSSDPKTIGVPMPHRNYSIPIAVNGAIPHEVGGGGMWDFTPSYTPPVDSPTNDDYRYSSASYCYPPLSSRPSDAYSTAYFGYPSFVQADRTPESSGSSTAGLPPWTRTAQDFSLNNSSDSEASYTASMGDLYSSVLAEKVLLPAAFGSSRMMTAVQRDELEKGDLLIPSSSPHDSVVDLNINEPAYTSEGRYLEAYWLWVHALYPIVHRPSFGLYDPSPLLKAAMMALGAHALGEVSDKTNALIVHERCMKVLKKRTLNDWHSFRLCDMQATFLVELYSVFKARRPPLQFSKAFEDVYRCLANDPAAANPLPDDLAVHGMTSYMDEYVGGRTQAHEVLPKQHLLAACYILDAQHAILFGRQQTSCYAGGGMELPFPAAVSSWDDQEGPQQRLDPGVRVWQILDGGNMDSAAQRQPHEVFQSMLMIACLTDPSRTSEVFHPSDPNKDLLPVIGAMQQSAQVKLAYNTFMLCKNTPVRDLLAVAGESWVMAEKLSNQADYVSSQIEARDWASAAGYPADFNASTLNEADEQQPPVHKAVRHALRILQLHMEYPKTGLPFQEWSIYLAAVAIWAFAHASSSAISAAATRRPRLSVPDPIQPRLSSTELEQTVTAVVSRPGSLAVEPDEARRVLLWAKAEIEKVDLPHNCGLTNGALDVLGKLALRGSEGGWFGV